MYCLLRLVRARDFITYRARLEQSVFMKRALVQDAYQFARPVHTTFASVTKAHSRGDCSDQSEQLPHTITNIKQCGTGETALVPRMSEDECFMQKR